jgi:hypothetical protein
MKARAFIVSLPLLCSTFAAESANEAKIVATSAIGSDSAFFNLSSIYPWGLLVLDKGGDIEVSAGGQSASTFSIDQAVGLSSAIAKASFTSRFGIFTQDFYEANKESIGAVSGAFPDLYWVISGVKPENIIGADFRLLYIPTTDLASSGRQANLTSRVSETISNGVNIISSANVTAYEFNSITQGPRIKTSYSNIGINEESCDSAKVGAGDSCQVYFDSVMDINRMYYRQLDSYHEFFDYSASSGSVASADFNLGFRYSSLIVYYFNDLIKRNQKLTLTVESNGNIATFIDETPIVSNGLYTDFKSAVPEPEGWLSASIGIFCLIALRRRSGKG